MAYNPTLGRWMQQDPAGYVDGLNIYLAVRSSPASLLDPGGLKSQPSPEKLPAYDARHGFAFPGGENFAGKGHDGTARTRPSGMLGFAAKVHDFMYWVNDVDAIVPAEDDLYYSRRAKADYIFMKMNNAMFGHLTWHGGLWAGLASLVFAGHFPECSFKKGDGFINVLSDQRVLAKLKFTGERELKRTNYLMIPYSELKGRRPTRLESRNEPVSAGTGTMLGGDTSSTGPPMTTVELEVPDYDRAVPDDLKPGWEDWAAGRYWTIWQEIRQITDQTGS